MNIEKLLSGEEKLSPAEKTLFYKEIANNRAALSEYIQSRAAVLEPRIAKESQIRQIFKTEDVSGGEQSYYPIGSSEVQTAWIAPDVGSAPRRQVEGDEVWIPTFNIYARVEWAMTLVEDGRFNIIGEQNFNFAEQIKEQENMAGWNLIKGAAADGSFPAANNVQIGSTPGVDVMTGKGFFSRQLFAEMMYAADVQRRKITDIYMTPRAFFDIFNYWGVTFSATGTNTTPVGIGSIPSGAAEDFFRQGPLGSGEKDTEFVYEMFGTRFHKVYDSGIMGDEEIYGFDLSGSRSNFGVMPIRQKLQTHEDPMAILEYKAGYFGRERLGFGILDPVNMFVGTIDRA